MQGWHAFPFNIYPEKHPQFPPINDCPEGQVGAPQVVWSFDKTYDPKHSSQTVYPDWSHIKQLLTMHGGLAVIAHWFPWDGEYPVKHWTHAPWVG